jgi:hypothetical protein
MRATCHVGEDYRRLSEGIRRIHEPFEFGMLRTGDRLGHALALADDARRWSDTFRFVSQPAEERLDDLVWELDRYGHADFHGHGSRIEHVRTEAVRLAWEIYGRQIDSDTLIRARQKRHDPRQLERLGFPFFSARALTRPDAAEELLFAYLTDTDVFERGQQLLEIESTSAETDFLITAQNWLRTLLGRLEITVEANPSSNLLIGAMAEFESHPLLRMQPLSIAPDAPEGASVLASINADDPLTFATCLADEYAYLHATLLRYGIEARKGLAWLDRLRENGYRSRFTLPASADKLVLEQLYGRQH